MTARDKFPLSYLVATCLAWLASLLTNAIARAAEPLTQRLLIIAPTSFHTQLEPYMAHKQKQLSTQLVALEKILAETEGCDDPEKLKRFLYNAWKADSIGYVLLVGDADVFPVRYMVLDRVTAPAFNYAFYPSDLYYSDLARADGSFDDWNAQKSDFHAKYFGEVRGEANKDDPINFDAIDYLPDVAVGRWPVSTTDEVTTVVTKSIQYETAVLSESKPGLRTAALFSVGGWVDSRSVMDGVASQFGERWKAEKRYYGRRDATGLPTEANLLELLNSGVGVAMHAGHGQDQAWEQCFPLKALDKIKNADRLPIVVSAGCSTARFATLPPYEAYRDIDGKDHQGSDHGEVFTAPPPPPAVYQSGKHNPPGLGEQLLRRGPDGAVAYIGCNTGSQPCGLSLLTGFAKSYSATKNPRLGDCWTGAVRYYHADQHLADLKPTKDWYPASIYFQAMKFMCFGDPSLVMP